MTRLLGVVTEERHEILEFASMPGGWAAFFSLLLLLATFAAVVWLYRREARAGASARLRNVLALLRCATLAILAIIWLHPIVATYIRRGISAHVFVLVDQSLSMSVPVGRAGDSGAERPVTRRDQADALLSRDGRSWLKRLAARNELSVLSFGAAVADVETGLESGQSATRPASAAEGERLFAGASYEPVTDIGAALSAAADHAGAEPIAGIVLVTDGAVNQGLSQDELLAFAGRLKVPIYPVGIGEVVEPPNVRVASLAVPTSVSKGDPFEIRADVVIDGLEEAAGEATSKLAVRLMCVAASGGVQEQLVAEREIEIQTGPDAEEIPPLIFTINPREAGEFIYRVAVAPLEEEPVTADNVRSSATVVLDDKIRVLMVAGGPSFDYRAVERLLERDKTIEVSTWLQSADAAAIRDGDVQLRELPRDPEDIFAYDVVMLMDPSLIALDASWAVNIRRLVDEFGGGMLYQAGTHYATRFLYEAAMSDLVAILPVQIDPDAAVKIHDQGNYITRPYPFTVPEDARGHPLLRLSDDGGSDGVTHSFWTERAGVWAHLPVLREKPVATVLLRHSNPALRNQFGAPVLFAAQSFGAGRTAFLAFNSTWRWRAAYEAQFNRFWVQLVRYLAQPRRQAGSKRGSIVIEQERIAVGSPFKIEARVLDEQFVPWHEPEIGATIESPDGEHVETSLRAIPGREGWFTGRVVMAREGVSTIRVALPGGRGAASDAELVRRVNVERPDVEMRGLRQRAEFLQRLAEESGGRYFTLANAGLVPDLIERGSRELTTRGPDRELWDRWSLLLLVAGLLCIEWALRRRNQLL